MGCKCDQSTEDIPFGVAVHIASQRPSEASVVIPDNREPGRFPLFFAFQYGIWHHVPFACRHE